MEVLTQLGVGEGLVSMLDEKGRPQMVQRTLIKPPKSQIGPITDNQRQQLLQTSLVAGVYDKVLDRESAHEILAERAEKMQQKALEQQSEAMKETVKRTPSRTRESPFEAFAKSTMRSLGSQIGRRLVRGILGSLMGGK